MAKTSVDNIVSKMISYVVKKEDELLEKAVRENAIPKVKGTITPNKLKWRGIRIVQRENRKWLEQRGKRISPVITRETYYTETFGK